MQNNDVYLNGILRCINKNLPLFYDLITDNEKEEFLIFGKYCIDIVENLESYYYDFFNSSHITFDIIQDYIISSTNMLLSKFSYNLDNLIDTYKDKRGKRLVFLIFLMFDHIGGLNTLLNCLSMNVAMVFPENREPDHVAHLIEKYKVNILPASPTFLNLMLIGECPAHYDLTSLRMITYGTEPMPESLLVKLKYAFPRVKFLQTFGTSETGISTTSSYSSTSTFLKIDDPNTEYKIINGELWLRSKTQIMGYLNSSMERFTDDGWFKTGDMVEEKDGYIKIIGRNSDIINVGGEKVLPSEVESVLFQMPHVNDCIVYGEKNPITGQMVVAKVLYNEDIKASELKKLVVEFCKDKLTRYKIPAKVVKMSDSEFTERYKKKRIN